MTKKIAVDNFLSKSKLAVVGASRNSKKFGYIVYQDLKKKDYKVFAINPNLESIDQDPCYPNLGSLPETVEGVVIVVPPAETEKIVKDVHAAKIKFVWMQQGSESETAIEFCKKNGIEVIYGECILMFAEPVASFHKFHRWIWKILKKLPK
jgi:predicted CoA-binding protein